jgi:puromycin-sensitive aminopeptidase
MLEQYLGPDRFRAGVSHYLDRHRYGNTETSDLWDAMEDVTGEPVRELMDSWIWQPGYPLVSARLDGTDLVLTQQRFAYGDDALDRLADAPAWMVPVQVRAGAGSSWTLLTGESTRIPLADPAAPVIVNAGGHGFFRVAYSDELLARLDGDVLEGLDTLERYNLADDAWNAVVAGRLAASEYLQFVEGFGAERESAVWQNLLIGLRGLGRLLDDADYPRYQARVAALLAPVVSDLGDPVDGESELTAKLRGSLTAALAVLGGDGATVARARGLYDASVAGQAVHPELLAAATSVVAATGDADDYARLLDGFKNAATPQDALRHLNALAEFDDEELVLRTCELCMSGDVKTQNAPFVLRLCIANRRHGAAAWRFVRERWADANAAFPQNTIVRMIGSVTLLTTPELVADVQAFFAEHPIPQAAPTLRQILERQTVNAALKERESANLAASL